MPLVSPVQGPDRPKHSAEFVSLRVAKVYQGLSDSIHAYRVLAKNIFELARSRSLGVGLKLERVRSTRIVSSPRK